MRWTEYARRDAALQRRRRCSSSTLIQRAAGLPAVQPAAASPACAAGPRLQHRRLASRPTPTGRPTAGESTMSYLTQMAGLAFHNFVSAAAGIALAIAFIRGIARRESDTHRQLLGRPDARYALRAAAALPRRRALPRLAGRRRRTCGRTPGALSIRSRDGTDAAGKPQTTVHRAGHRPGAGRLAGDHQGARHQRRRLLQRQPRAPVREPDAAHQLPRDAGASSPSRPG